MVGSLGCGKSTILDSVLDSDKIGTFEASDGTVGCTQQFYLSMVTAKDSALKDTILIDSPGWNDPNLPL